MAIDECENCTVRGNYLKCAYTHCANHNTWYVKELKRLYENKKIGIPDNQSLELVSQKLPNVPDGTPHHPQGEHNGNDEFAD